MVRPQERAESGAARKKFDNGNGKKPFRKPFRKGGRPGQKPEERKDRSQFEITVPKIIMRNLSFKLNEDLLRKDMEKYGPIKMVSLPKKPDGKMLGYGFVVYNDLESAQKAIDDLNSKKFHNNTVAVDWCLPKNVFVRNMKIKGHRDEEAKKAAPPPPPPKKSSDDEDDAEEEDEEEEKDEEEDDEEDSEGKEQSDDEDASEEEAEIDDEEDEDMEQNGSEEDEEAGSDEDDFDEDEDEESDEEARGGKAKKAKKVADPEKSEVLVKKQQTGTKDVQEERTVFVRNLSFDIDKETVADAFSKFGKVKSVFICMDRELERPKGTAFIQFEEKQGAVNACAESGMFELDSRTLQIDLAVPRTRANELVEERKLKTPKDNRNLALAKEGTVYPNSYEAKGVSKADMMRRQKIEQANTEKLKLLHYFVSPKRLAVHNIPLKCTDDELRSVFESALHGKTSEKDRVVSTLKSARKAGIMRCRIMRDLTRLNAEGVGRSKGYGFIDFESHERAKKALHATNNNPDLFKTGTRLIVQFSIEDMRALKKREKRVEKSRLKQRRALIAK